MDSASTFIPDLIYIATQAGYGTYGVTLFKGSLAILPASMPVGYRALISFSRTGGAGEAGTHNLSRDQVAYERPSAQIVSRAENPNDAEDIAYELYNLYNFYDTFINRTWWRTCGPKQEPFDLGADARGRMRYAFNIDSEKRVSPATSY
jgi:hypothetical protein